MQYKTVDKAIHTLSKRLRMHQRKVRTRCNTSEVTAGGRLGKPSRGGTARAIWLWVFVPCNNFLTFSLSDLQSPRFIVMISWLHWFIYTFRCLCSVSQSCQNRSPVRLSVGRMHVQIFTVFHRSPQIVPNKLGKRFSSQPNDVSHRRQVIADVVDQLLLWVFKILLRRHAKAN